MHQIPHRIPIESKTIQAPMIAFDLRLLSWTTRANESELSIIMYRKSRWLSSSPPQDPAPALCYRPVDPELADQGRQPVAPREQSCGPSATPSSNRSPATKSCGCWASRPPARTPIPDVGSGVLSKPACLHVFVDFLYPQNLPFCRVDFCSHRAYTRTCVLVTQGHLTTSFEFRTLPTT